MIRFFDPGKAYLAIKEEVDAEMQRVLTSGDLILRHDVCQFEESFAQYVGTKYAIGVASGTDALILSLKALGVTGKVLVPSYSFRATVEAVVHAGCEPVLYDFDDFLDFRGVSAWIPAHIAGDKDPLFTKENIEKAKEVIIIEDACQAVGAFPIVGDTACYSFYPAKILGCYGDGGAIATNNEELYSKLLIYRNHNKGDWSEVGYNSRLDNLQAAVLNMNLKYLPDAIARRREIAEMYYDGLEEVVPDSQRNVYQDYIIVTTKRDALYDFLLENGIETLKNGYPYPALYPKGEQTIRYEDNSLRLPCNPELTDEEVEYIIEKVNEFHVRDM